MPKKKSHSDFIKQMNEINSDIAILGNYEGVQTPIHCKCRICGYEWNPRPGNLLHGYGCPECGKITAKKKLRKNPEEFKEHVKRINPNIELIEEYVDYKTKILCKCTVCGNVWKANPGDIYNGHGCLKCYHQRSAQMRAKTHDTYIRQIQEKNPAITILGKYQNGKKPIKCQCNICGNVWNPKASDLLQGCGCPECNHIGTSLVEQILLLSFKAALSEVEVVSRDRKAIGKELDIYIPNLQFAIEYGAYYWHKNKLAQDNDKEQRCAAKGIRLIRIYEKCDDDSDLRFNQNVILYKKEISNDDLEIRTLIERLYSLSGIKYSMSTNRYFAIKEQAYLLSRKQTTDEFKKKLKKINPNIIVLGEYRGSHQLIRVQCAQCGRKWNSTPHTLQAGYQCRNCYLNKRFLPEEEYRRRVAQKNPKIKITGEYKGSNNPILCKCTICGNEWSPLAKNLLKYGCRECTRREKTGKTKITQEEFKEKVYKTNPNVKIVGEYKGSHEPIKCRCLICGNEWSTIAYNIMTGHGCRKCFGKRHSEKMKEYYKKGKLGINKKQ